MDFATDDDFTESARPWEGVSTSPATRADSLTAIEPPGIVRETRADGRRIGTQTERVTILAIGDVHGLYEPVFRALREVPDAAAILQVGDLTAGKPGRETHVDGDPRVIDGIAIPFIWVHGNHEHWELFSAARGADGTRHARLETPGPRLPGTHLWAGTHAYVPGTNIGVVGLPGNYAPSWYSETKPFPGDRCRHFNRDDVDAMARHPYPNVLLMHEAFRGQAPGRVGTMGIPVLARLVAELQPAVVLTGHHHLFAAQRHGPTLAISLPPAWDGYARLVFRRSGALISWEFRDFSSDDTFGEQATRGLGRRHLVERAPIGVGARGKIT